MVTCIKKSRFKDMNTIGFLIAFTIGFIFHKYGIEYGLFTVSNRNEHVEMTNKYINALVDKTTKNSFEKFVKQTPVIKFMNLKKGLSGKEDHIGLSLIIENALIPSSSSPSSIQVSSTTTHIQKDKEAKKVKFYNNNLPWANSLKKKKGWIFNNVCPLTCDESNIEIAWGSKESLCPMSFRPEMKLFMKHLRSYKSVLEFGSGISTFYYSQCVKQYDSIEENLSWCNELLNHVPPNTKIHCKENSISYDKLLKDLCILKPGMYNVYIYDTLNNQIV